MAAGYNEQTFAYIAHQQGPPNATCYYVIGGLNGEIKWSSREASYKPLVKGI
jgi:hypothetical protein